MRRMRQFRRWQLYKEGLLGNVRERAGRGGNQKQRGELPSIATADLPPADVERVGRGEMLWDERAQTPQRAPFSEKYHDGRVFVCECSHQKDERHECVIPFEYGAKIPEDNLFLDEAEEPENQVDIVVKRYDSKASEIALQNKVLDSITFSQLLDRVDSIPERALTTAADVIAMVGDSLHKSAAPAAGAVSHRRPGPGIRWPPADLPVIRDAARQLRDKKSREMVQKQVAPRSWRPFCSSKHIMRWSSGPDEEGPIGYWCRGCREHQVDGRWSCLSCSEFVCKPCHLTTWQLSLTEADTGIATAPSVRLGGGTRCLPCDVDLDERESLEHAASGEHTAMMLWWAQYSAVDRAEEDVDLLVEAPLHSPVLPGNSPYGPDKLKVSALSHMKLPDYGFLTGFSEDMPWESRAKHPPLRLD